MTKMTLAKSLIVVASTLLIAAHVQARPDYLKLFAADPLSRPELRSQCSLCHLNPGGGGPRNDFGKAFVSEGFKITAELRRRFPQNFVSEGSQPPVSFVAGSDSEAVVEINGKKYVINTKTKTVTEMNAARPEEKVAASMPTKQVAKEEAARAKVYQQADTRLINLPTSIPIPKGSFWAEFTHRFPFSDPTDAAGLYGLDTMALPSFGFMYGVTDRIHVGGYRSPGDLGRPIELFAGVSLLSEQKGDPLSLTARVGLEGRDNLKRNFATSFEFDFARSITRHAQLYIVPTVTFGDRPLFIDVKSNAPGETAVALGAGLAVNIRPSVALMAEGNYRLNEASRYIDGLFGVRRPVIGFGVQKVSSSRRHVFSLIFTNGPGTTMSQRSMTRGLLGGNDSAGGLGIGFNVSRRMF